LRAGSNILKPVLPQSSHEGGGIRLQQLKNSSRWPGRRWGDMERLRAAARVTTNVVDFMTNELRMRLAPSTRTVLSLAACLEDGFSLKMLTLVCQQVSHRGRG
jgi:hypothetical protein